MTCFADLCRGKNGKFIHLPQNGHYTINFCYLVVPYNEQNKQTGHVDIN